MNEITSLMNNVSNGLLVSNLITQTAPSYNAQLPEIISYQEDFEDLAEISQEAMELSIADQNPNSIANSYTNSLLVNNLTPTNSFGGYSSSLNSSMIVNMINFT